MVGPGGIVEGVRRIGVLRANGIGDFLMIVPALESLRRAYPEAELTLLGDEWLPPFLEGRPGPWDEVAVAPRYPGLRGRPAEAAVPPELDAFLDEHRGRYDLLLQMHGGGRTSNTLVRSLEPRLAAGARTPDAEPLDRWVPYLPYRHEVLRWLDIAALVGGEPPNALDGLRPALTVTDADRRAGRAASSVEGPVLVMHVGARDRRRCWPAAKFADVAGRLMERTGHRVLLVGGPDDRVAAKEVAGALGDDVVDLTGTLTLSETLGVLATAALFVGNDSGPRHLAVAARVPTVGVFWVGNALTFGPLVGGCDRALISFRTDCPVCGREQVSSRCEHDVPFVDDISVEEVYREAVSLLADTG